MNITFLPPAEAELLDAVAYYNSQSEGLVRLRSSIISFGKAITARVTGSNFRRR